MTPVPPPSQPTFLQSRGDGGTSPLQPQSSRNSIQRKKVDLVGALEPFRIKKKKKGAKGKAPKAGNSLGVKDVPYSKQLTKPKKQSPLQVDKS